MSAYAIDFSDPLKGGFSIPAGGFNGPGGSSANTSLRLYGRGALEWGEAVDEDLVRLTENFASASAPSSAITGQTWVEQTLYYRNTSLGNVLQGWYYYDINEVAPNKWKLVLGTGIVPGTAPLSPTEGQYYYDGPGSVLRGFYSLGKYEPAAWVDRSSISGTGAPVSPTVVPIVKVKVYNGGTGQWVVPTGTTVAGAAPTTPAIGDLWYDTSTGHLKVWNGAAWQIILGPTNGGGSTTSAGILDMGGFKIINLGAPTLGTDAVTKTYVDGLVGGAGAGTYLPLAGGTLSGSVTFNGGTVVHNVNSTFTTLSSSGLATLNSISAAGAITAGGNLTTNGLFYANSAAQVASTLNVNGTSNLNSAVNIAGLLTMSGTRITNMANASLGQDAVTLNQVNSLISGATGGLLTAGSVALANYGGVPKDCDIRTIGPNIVEIYSNGAWRRVFPAQWVA